MCANIIENQNVWTQKYICWDSLIENNDCKTVAFASLNSTVTISFSNLNIKKVLSNTFQRISIETRSETGQLVPFSETGKVTLFFQFTKLGKYKMELHLRGIFNVSLF